MKARRAVPASWCRWAFGLPARRRAHRPHHRRSPPAAETDCRVKFPALWQLLFVGPLQAASHRTPPCKYGLRKEHQFSAWPAKAGAIQDRTASFPSMRNAWHRRGRWRACPLADLPARHQAYRSSAASFVDARCRALVGTLDHLAIGTSDLKLATQCRKDIKDLAHLDGRLAAFEFDKKPQANTACCGKLVLAQAEFLALVPNDAAYHGNVVHLALHFPFGKYSQKILPFNPYLPEREQPLSRKPHSHEFSCTGKLASKHASWPSKSESYFKCGPICGPRTANFSRKDKKLKSLSVWADSFFGHQIAAAFCPDLTHSTCRGAILKGAIRCLFQPTPAEQKDHGIFQV